VNDKILRQHVIKLLDGHEAHADWKQALAGLPAKLRGVRPDGAPHSIWDLIEHMRIAQWDILEFSRNGEHVSPDWPSGYWPASGKTPSDRDWKSCLRKFAADAAAMKKLVARSKTDLTAKIPHGTGQTVLREALLLADHNSYHVGQIVLVRRLLGDWPKS
jgi:DinB superfamily